MLKINKFVCNSFYENTFIVWDDESLEAAVIDPGCSDEIEQEEFADFVSENKLKVKYLILTHAHIDHVLGCNFIYNTYRPVFMVPANEINLLNIAPEQADMFGIELKTIPPPNVLISEDQEVELGNSKLKFLFTPGHTEGEVCIYLEKEKICITGDVLFNEGIGRTDLWGGNYDTLIKSIKEKLLTLPDDVVIYPGHGEESSILHEKQNNPFLKNII